jgi:hypothetical protein
MQRERFGTLIVVTLGIASCTPATPDQPTRPEGYVLVPGNWVPSYGAPAQGAFTVQPPTSTPVCRAAHDGGRHPGKFYAGQCFYEWHDQNYTVSRFETLVDPGTYSWFRLTLTECAPDGTCATAVSPMPANAIDGGSAGEMLKHVRMPVCKAWYRDRWYPGKFLNGRCHITHAWSGYQLDPVANDVHIAVTE